MAIERNEENFRKALREFLASWRATLCGAVNDLGDPLIDVTLRIDGGQNVGFDLTRDDTTCVPVDGLSFGIHDEMLFICDEQSLRSGCVCVGAYIDRRGNPQRILRDSSYGTMLFRVAFHRVALDIGPVVEYIVRGLMDTVSGATGTTLILDDLNHPNQRSATEAVILFLLGRLGNPKGHEFSRHIDHLVGIRSGEIRQFSFGQEDLSAFVHYEIMYRLA